VISKRKNTLPIAQPKTSLYTTNYPTSFLRNTVKKLLPFMKNNRKNRDSRMIQTLVVAEAAEVAVVIARVVTVEATREAEERTEEIWTPSRCVPWMRKMLKPANTVLLLSQRSPHS